VISPRNQDQPTGRPKVARDPERNAWAGRSDTTPCRKPLAWVGAVQPCVPTLADLETVVEYWAGATGDDELDGYLLLARLRLAALAREGGA
jgi:hypothetical protein